MVWFANARGLLQIPALALLGRRLCECAAERTRPRFSDACGAYAATGDPPSGIHRDASTAAREPFAPTHLF